MIFRIKGIIGKIEISKVRGKKYPLSNHGIG